MKRGIKTEGEDMLTLDDIGFFFLLAYSSLGVYILGCNWGRMNLFLKVLLLCVIPSFVFTSIGKPVGFFMTIGCALLASFYTTMLTLACYRLNEDE